MIFPRTRNVTKGFPTVWAIPAIYGVLVIPIDFLISLKSNSLGFGPAMLLAFRSGGWIMLMVALFSATLFILLKILNWAKPDMFEAPLQQAILIGSGVVVIFFFFLFDRFYNKSEALVAVEVLGGASALVLGVISYSILRSGNMSQRATVASPKVAVTGTLVIFILFGVSLLGSGHMNAAMDSEHGSGKSTRPNILLIVMDTVRADRLSLYGYHLKTTLFLEKIAKESAVFNNAFAASPWTLPSHASLFTGLYPSQHNTHGEHFWLDNSYRTLAEMLYDEGYQTVSFSNNGYITSYHNLTQGFERSWFKGRWTDDIALQPSLGSSVVSFFNWFWKQFQVHVIAKIIKNPVSISDNPTATITNKAIYEWLDNGRERSKPFFIFINYMDAHFPYNPPQKVARLFLNEEELKISYRQDLRFPPIEHCLDLSKSGYSERDIRIISALYDASIRYLDGGLENLFNKLVSLGIHDETLIIITSDHGEYLGTRNRLAHGLGLHDEVLHVPLIIRYPKLFGPGTRYDTLVTHIDIPETILSFSGISERPEGMKEAQLLYDLKETFRPNVFAEFRFPLHLLTETSLLEDNSKWFVEQKTMRSLRNQLIWKSRGEPEFYDLIKDPFQLENLYSRDMEKAEIMKKKLISWFESLHHLPQGTPEVIGISKKEDLELLERLRGIGYIK